MVDSILSKDMKMSDRDCEKLSQMVTSFCGIKLGVEKKGLMQSRLDKRLRELSLPTYKEYFKYLEDNTTEFEVLINSLTTNKTEFWRENAHYEQLKKIVLENYLHRNSRHPFYIWSGASSTFF